MNMDPKYSHLITVPCFDVGMNVCSVSRTSLANLYCFTVSNQRIFLSTVVPEANLIINAVGKDRLGIVSDVTKMVIDAGGNVGDSQAAKLGSHFSLMMLVTLPKEKVDAFKTSLDSLSDMNAAVYEAEAGDISMGPEIGCE